MTTYDGTYSGLQRARQRRARGSVPAQPITRIVPIDSSIPATAFTVFTQDITFSLAFRVTGATSGLIFAIGDATAAVALWMKTEALLWRAGGSLPANGASAQFQISGGLSVGRLFTIECAVRRGRGQVRMWDEVGELARAGNTPAGPLSPGWAASGLGSYGQAAAGPLPTDVTELGAPAGITLTQPLRIYNGTAPRKFN